MSINTEYEEKINDAIYTFENVKSVNELQKLTLDFIKGKLIATNYHYGPLHKESKKIINELIKMNELGFITINSQPGEIEYEIRRQRGYVCGIIKKNQLDKFSKLLYEISSNIYKWIDNYEKEGSTYYEFNSVNVNPEDIYFSQNMQEHNIGIVADWDSAFKFSTESINNTDSFAGHGFWISDMNWKQRLNRLINI
jgi:hypothetical protein